MLAAKDAAFRGATFLIGDYQSNKARSQLDALTSGATCFLGLAVAPAKLALDEVLRLAVVDVIPEHASHGDIYLALRRRNLAG